VNHHQFFGRAATAGESQAGAPNAAVVLETFVEFASRMVPVARGF
jgi:hypothetical protein